MYSYLSKPRKIYGTPKNNGNGKFTFVIIVLIVLLIIKNLIQ